MTQQGQGDVVTTEVSDNLAGLIQFYRDRPVCRSDEISMTEMGLIEAETLISHLRSAQTEITRLRTLLSSSRGEQGWRDDIKAAPHGKKVIVRAKGDFQGERTMMARFYPKHTLEAPDGYGASDGFDEDEHGDAYAPEGWYEDMEAETPPLHNIEPTHWMPLPSAPGSVPTSLAGQVPDGVRLTIENVEQLDAIMAQATCGAWEWTTFTTPDGSPIVCVEDVAETVAASAMRGDGTELHGITPAGLGDSAEGPNVICYTGNGPCSAANARAIVSLWMAAPDLLKLARSALQSSPQPTAGGDASALAAILGDDSPVTEADRADIEMFDRAIAAGRTKLSGE